ncbi:hypothetical protein SAMN05192575_101440 [Nocardioides alpinus]|uniref:Right handed beta helix region n=1 Tax=Nocardioides alpinus TaxID=748909 RepID=A0A1I0VSW2_9ACTN|nr:hypothetical protein [Nocardioides alpinus]SFA79505.1 hypothetical protein SAMN05192575_101440 [Nocardioides alpinus]
MSSPTRGRLSAAFVSVVGLATALLAAPTLASAGPAPAHETSPVVASVQPTDTLRSQRAERKWPSAANTGVPAGVTLQPYNGPCAITRDNTVIDGKLVDCDLEIRAAGVIITNSKINGTVWNDYEAHDTSFKIRRSNVDAGEQVWSGIGSIRFTARRVEVVGGTRSIMCWYRCKVIDSYVHGQMTDEAGKEHESGVRMGSQAKIIHNTLTCDAPDVPPDAGCSASLTGYGDGAVVEDNLIENNLFLASTGGACAYGGSTKGKPYSDGVNNIRFIDNVFERGPTGNCGYWFAITDFDKTAPGNVWSGNRWRHSEQRVPPA